MSGVKCTSKRFLPLLGACLSCSIFLTGCGSTLGMTFQDNFNYSNFNFLIDESGSAEVVSPFASDICVVDGNHLPKEVKDVPETTSAALFDLNHCDVLYAKDVFTQV